MISEEEFVAVNVALRTARYPVHPPGTALSPADSAKAREDSATIRREVLEREEITPQQLRGFVRARRGDTEALAEVWREIARAVARQDSTVRAEAGASPGAPQPI